MGSQRSLPVEYSPPLLSDLRSQLQAEISKIPATDHMTLFVAGLIEAVVERFESLQEQKGVEAVKAVVDEFSAFRVTFVKTNLVVFRMAFTRRMFERLTGLSKALEDVVDSVELNITDKTAWKEKLQAARILEETELSVIAKKSTMPFVRNVQGHEAMEALTLMKFEIDFYPPPDGNSKLHVASMKSVFFSIVRSSNGRVSKIPDWYSPPYLAVKEFLPPIGDHFIAKCTRATWADRHQNGKIVPVVMKQMPLEADGIDLYRREVEVWASLQHSNIIRLLGASHCSSPTVLVLEDATNGAICDYVFQPVNKKLVWKLLLDVALGLQYLHKSHGVVHGNLKPTNLLVVNDDEKVVGKLSDFGGGLATLQNRALQYKKYEETSVEQPVAKYAKYGESVKRWRAPEYQSHDKRPTYQGDVYSLGMCIVNAVDRNFVPPIGEIPPGDLDRIAERSGEAKELVLAMMAADPEKRLDVDKVVAELAKLSGLNPIATAS